jgi:hypothetical protein
MHKSQRGTALIASGGLGNIGGCTHRRHAPPAAAALPAAAGMLLRARPPAGLLHSLLRLGRPQQRSLSAAAFPKRSGERSGRDGGGGGPGGGSRRFPSSFGAGERRGGGRGRGGFDRFDREPRAPPQLHTQEQGKFPFQYLVTCHPGLEMAVAEELMAPHIGACAVEAPQPGRVTFG